MTLLCGVPRVFERFYDRVQAGIQEKSCLARSIAEKAFRVQTDNIRRGLRMFLFFVSDVVDVLGCTAVVMVAGDCRWCTTLVFERIVSGLSCAEGWVRSS